MKINKKLLILALFLGVLVFSILFFINNKKTEQHIPLSNLSSNVQFPWYNQNDMYYFSGSSFVKYGLHDNKTTRLSNFMYINSELSSVQWTENSVIFTVPEVKDDIFSQAVNQFKPHGDEDLVTAPISLSSADNHWWRYDFAANKLQLLFFDGAEECTSMQEVEESIICSRPHRGSKLETEIKTYNIASGEIKTLFINKTPIHDYVIRDKNIYYISSTIGGVESIYTRSLEDPSQAKTIYTSKDALASFSITENDKQLLIQEVKKPDSSATYRSDNDHIDKSSDPIWQNILLLSNDGKKITNTTVESPLGETIVNKNELYFYSKNGVFIDMKDEELQISRTTAEALGDVVYLFKNRENVYATDREGDFYTSYTSEVPLNDSTFTASGDEAGNFYINNANQQNQNLVYLYDSNKAFIENSEEVAKYLITKGFDPNLFNLKWIIDSTSNEITLDQEVNILTAPGQQVSHSHQ